MRQKENEGGRTGELNLDLERAEAKFTNLDNELHQLACELDLIRKGNE